MNSKPTLIATFLLLFSWMPIFAQNAPLAFVAKEGIYKWVKDSSYPGAEIREYKHNGKSLLVVVRNMSTDSFSSEVWAFVYDLHEGWTEALRVQRLQGVRPSLKQDGDLIHITNAPSGPEILTISISQIQAASF
ncbi:MAG: hypothetical protein IPQ13_13815 [Holophagaceae bacterium]|nr:hypothetical protein [Holophagaceae bacterium]